MQAVAAELSGCAEKFYCFLERRVLIAKNPSTQAQECCDADLGARLFVPLEFLNLNS